MAARFAGKVGIITGAGSGIGKATIERFVAEGGMGVAVDISEIRLTQLEQKFHSRNQLITCVSGDLTKDATIDQILQASGEKIDVLINNAGIMDDFVPLDELDD